MTTPDPGLLATLGLSPADLAGMPALGGTPAGPRVYLGPMPALRDPKGAYGAMSPEGRERFDATVAGSEYSLEREHMSRLPAEARKSARDVVDLDTAALRILSWPESEQEALGQRLVDAGLLKEPYSRDELEQAWEKLCARAARYAEADPNTTMTPFDMIGLYGGPQQEGKPDVRTVVSRATSMLTNDDARRMLNGMLSEELGRRATDAEIDDFQAAMNEAQRNHPTVTTSTTTTDAAGNATVQQSVEGGFDPGGFTSRYVEEDEDMAKEHASYMAATTYMDALMRAVQSPVPY